MQDITVGVRSSEKATVNVGMIEPCREKGGEATIVQYGKMMGLLNHHSI